MSSPPQTAAVPSEGPPLLEVQDLRVHYAAAAGGWARAVDGISFTLRRGACLGLIGESGCGKSLTALALLGLLPGRPRVSGSVRVEGVEVVGAKATSLRQVRGRRVGLVFQEAGAALDPLMRCGEQVAEGARWHLGLGRGAARAHAEALLAAVGLPAPGEVASAYPHELSGGMQQRVAIAAALSATPPLLVADEPTTALDPRVQARLLRLLAELRRTRDLALLLISHDVAAVAELADELAVMYAGRIVERGPLATLLAEPAHPYTRALLEALPRLGAAPVPIPGAVPDPAAHPEGCRFRPRCPRAAQRCWQEPELRERGGRAVACHFPGAAARRRPQGSP